MGVMPAALDPAQAHVPLPGKWTFWAETMPGMTGRPATRLGYVDVSSFYCVRRVSAFGHGNVTFNLPCGLDTDTLLTLWSWRLWAFYDGEPYWCGVPTGLADENGSSHVQFTLIELPGYLTRRVWDYYPNRWYLLIEQMDIARDIAQPVEDVGVRIITEQNGPPLGVRRNRNYEFLEGGSRAQLLINLSGVIDGPEFRTEYRMTDQGTPECILRMAYPRVGSDGAGLGVSVPGAVLSYRAQFDSDQLRTRTYAVGDLPAPAEGEPSDPEARRPVVELNRSNPRLPRLDAVDDWPGTILVPTLRERADTMSTIHQVPAQKITGSPPESFPDIHTYGPGDTVTVRAVTPLIPDGIEFAARLEQIEVNAGTGIATWTLGVVQPPQSYRETIGGAIQRVSSANTALFHSGGLIRR